jgi:hypothetical protein
MQSSAALAPAPVFEVAFTDASGEQRRGPLAELCSVRFEHAVPRRVVSRRAWPSSSATMTRSVWPRMSVVARVPEDVRGGLVVECGVFGDGVDDAAGGPGAQPPALGVEEQRRVGLGVRPGRALLQPLVQLGAELFADLDGAGFAAFAPDPQLGLSSGEPDVVDLGGRSR